MAGDKAEATDKRIINLAADVADAENNAIPRILLKIQSILDSYPQGSAKLKQAKVDLWAYELLQVALTALKQDFSKLLEGWSTAGKLTSILCQCCIGLDPADSHHFYGLFLPETSETIMKLALKLQNKYIKTSDILEDVKSTVLENFRSVLDSLSLLFSGHDFIIIHVMKSPWVLQLLITDDLQTSMATMTTIQSANRMKPGLFANLDEKVIHQILDEIIYKLSATEAVELAGSSTRTLLVICDSHPPIVELLCTRYKGLKPLLNKWAGKGFGQDLRRLQLLLDAGSMKQAELKKFDQAARVIQAWYKSYDTRKRLGKANKAIGSLQRSFRARKANEERHKEEAREQRELEHFLLVSRKRALRELRQKELHAIEILPAGEVTKHLETQQTDAAVKLQKVWRGATARMSIKGKELQVRKLRAVIKMQRAVRKWLERVRAKKREPPQWQRPPGLTDERRVLLQAKIMEWRESHEVQTKGKETQHELHEKVQGTLRLHAIGSRFTRKKHQQRDALLGRLELDSNLLMTAPKLDEVSAKDFENFTCHSVPIATKARHNHNEELRLLRQPWWKKLGDKYQDKKLEEELGTWKVF